jgi:Flp pilus assembly protein TadB
MDPVARETREWRGRGAKAQRSDQPRQPTAAEGLAQDGVDAVGRHLQGNDPRLIIIVVVIIVVVIIIIITVVVIIIIILTGMWWVRGGPRTASYCCSPTRWDGIPVNRNCIFCSNSFLYIYFF